MAVRLMQLFVAEQPPPPMETGGSTSTAVGSSDDGSTCGQGGTSSTKQRDYVELTSLLGLYFQIRDDYANLAMDEYAANKSFAEDLTEGKFNFPIIHAIR